MSVGFRPYVRPPANAPPIPSVPYNKYYLSDMVPGKWAALTGAMGKQDTGLSTADLDALLGLGGFRGVVVCDGIYASSAAARWWQAVGEEGVAGGGLLEKYDVSPLGDGSMGTGLLDFGGLVRFGA